MKAAINPQRSSTSSRQRGSHIKGPALFQMEESGRARHLPFQSHASGTWENQSPVSDRLAAGKEAAHSGSATANHGESWDNRSGVGVWTRPAFHRNSSLVTNTPLRTLTIVCLLLAVLRLQGKHKTSVSAVTEVYSDLSLETADDLLFQCKSTGGRPICCLDGPTIISKHGDKLE